MTGEGSGPADDESILEDQLRALSGNGIDLSLEEPRARCGSCNGSPERAAEYPEHAPDDADCYRCRDCWQWFWVGSHWSDVEETLASL